MKKEEIESLALDIPFAYKISHDLQKMGISITEQIDREKLVNELCRLHLKK